MGVAKRIADFFAEPEKDRQAWADAQVAADARVGDVRCHACGYIHIKPECDPFALPTIRTCTYCQKAIHSDQVYVTREDGPIHTADGRGKACSQVQAAFTEAAQMVYSFIGFHEEMSHELRAAMQALADRIQKGASG